MANADYNPTIIAASLNDTQLKASINSLVTYVSEQTQQMANSFNSAVSSMEQRMKSLSSSGATSNNSTTKLVEDTKKVSQAAKETKVSFDQLAQATSKATGGNTIMETYDMQLKQMIDRLRQVRADIDIFNYAIGSGNKAEVEWGQRGLKEANKEAEHLMRVISELESKRGALASVMQPQGDTIKNFVKDLQKANPELALLNQQYRNGTALLQQKGTVLRRVSQEEQESASAITRTTEQVINEEKRRREAIIQTGLAARQTAEETKQKMREQASMNVDTPIQGAKELTDALAKMRSAYWNMDAATQESPIGKALMTDIIHAKNALKAVQDYNRELFQGQKNTIADVSKVSTAETLKKSLSQLTNEYNKLSIAEIDAGKDKGIVEQFQRISRAAQLLQRNLQRPISLDAVKGLDENTLDNIAYKLQQLQLYKSGLNLTDPKQAGELRQVDAEINRLNADLNKYMSTTQQAQGANNALTRSWNYMKNRLAFYFTVGASTMFIRNLIEVRGQYEMNERALGILINSAERGTQVFKELSEMALVSPYTLIELSSAAKQLTAYGVAAKDVVDTTRRMADMAAAVGIPMERLTYALGQIKAYGYLNSRDQRMFANAGIPLVKQLADYYTELEGRLVSTADVYDRIKKRAVDYNTVMQVMYKMTDEGGKFFNYQEKMASTLKVQLANLTLAWNNMLNDIGASEQGIIVGGIKGLKQLFLAWKSIDSAIKNAAISFGIYKALQFTLFASFGVLKEYNVWVALVGKRLTDLGIAAGKAIAALATNPMTWVGVAIYSLWSIKEHFNEIDEAAREMCRNIVKYSKEAADALEKYLGSETTQTTKASAKSKTLSELDAKKAWEELREQIELSSGSANKFIAELMKIPDINERISKGFELAEKIEIANRKLEGLSETALKISQDSWANGLFGEGLAEDAEDYVNYITGKGWQFYKGQSANEAKNEMKVLADDMAEILKERLGKDAFDPVILKEAVERLRKAIKDANPKIKGEVAQWFDVELDQLLGERFKGVYDAQSSLQEQFLTILKRDYASAFASVTDDVVKESGSWEKAQITAIKKAAEELKKTTVPEFRSAIDSMLQYMNSQDWRIKITTVMGTAIRSAFQEEFDREVLSKFGKAGMAAMSKYRPKEGQEMDEWADDMRNAYAKATKAQKDYTGKSTEYTQKRNEELNGEQTSIEELFKIWNLNLEKEKKGGKGGSQKDPLGDSMQKNIQYINELRKSYKEYLDLGYDKQTALTEATKHFGRSLENVNAILAKYGIAGLKGEDVAGMDLRDIRNYYQGILEYAQASGKATEALEKEIAKLDDEIMKTTQKTAIDSLKSGLSNLKDEYELAMDFEANPEMGDVFAEMMGMSEDELKSLPHDFEGVVSKMQEVLDKKLGAGKFDIVSNLNKSTFEKWVNDNQLTLDNAYVDALRKMIEDLNKIRQDETTKQVQEWNKLLEKYAEYEYKISQIHKQAEREREIARKQNAPREVFQAIKQRELQDVATEQFNLFKESPSWIAATEDLATLSSGAIDVLIKNIEKFKKETKGLTPKQIKEINKSLRQLKNEQRKDNPFAKLGQAISDAKDRLNEWKQELEDTTEKVKDYNMETEDGVEHTEAEEKGFMNMLDRIKELQELIKNGSGNIKEIVDGIAGIQQFASMAANDVASMFEAFGNTEAAENIKKITSVLDKAIQGAQIGASFGAYGAAIGAVAGGLMGAITAFAEDLNGNAAITKQIESSERIVKNLQNAYINLDRAVEKAYGTEKYYAIQIAEANKQAELAELKRQLRLEKSRSSKYRDEDKILDLERQILELENDISDALDEIVNDLLGISSVGDAVEDMVGNLIEALRNGENAMDTFDDSIDDMIANMVKKLYSSKVIGKWFDDVWATIDEDIDDRTSGYREELAELERQYLNYQNERGRKGATGAASFDFLMLKWKDKYGLPTKGWGSEGIEEYYERVKNILESEIAESSGVSVDDIKKYAELLSSGKPVVEGQLDSLEALLRELGLIKDTANEKLSNLQQGIQGITEDTAGALESYMNSVSQQCYFQSEVLVQIRDTIQTFDFDVQLGVQSQMLFQLQQSYTTQMAIQNILENALSPTGRAFRVEME